MKEEQQTSLAARQDFITQLIQDEDYPPEYMERLSDEKKEKVNRQAHKIKSGLYAIAPIKCKGPDVCPFISHCPLAEYTSDGELSKSNIDDYPIGYACVLESSFVRLKTIEYVKYLAVDPANPIEMAIVNDLCLIDLYKNRATIILSAGDSSGQGVDFLRIDTSQVIDTGNGEENMIKIQTVQEHPALTVIEKLERRRQKLIEQLSETRHQKIKQAEKTGQIKQSSKLMRELERIKDVLKDKKEKIETDTLPEIPLKD